MPNASFAALRFPLVAERVEASRSGSGSPPSEAQELLGQLVHVRGIQTETRLLRLPLSQAGRAVRNSGGAARGKKGKSWGSREQRGRTPGQGPLESQLCLQIRLSGRGFRGFHTHRDTEEPSTRAPPHPLPPRKEPQRASFPRSPPRQFPTWAAARAAAAASKGAQRTPRLISRGSR